MKRILLAFALLPLPAARGYQSLPMGALPMTQNTSPVPQCFVLGANQPVTTPAMNTTGAGVVVIGVSWYGDPGTGHITIADNLGNAAPAALPVYGGAATSVNISTFYYLSPTVGPSQSFTIGSTVSTFYASACVIALAGVTVLDKGSINGLTSSSSATCSPGSITLGSGAHKVVTTVDLGLNTSPTIDSSFTLDGYIPGSGGFYDGIALAHGTVGAGTIAPTWSMSGGNIPSCSIVSFH